MAGSGSGFRHPVYDRTLAGGAGRRAIAAAFLFGFALPVALEGGAQEGVAQEGAAKAGISALEPAFRLAAGGLPIAGPVLDARSSPAAVWLLSEDLSLYALTDEGGLVARIGLPERPLPVIALDPFGRVIVLGEGGAKLSAFTRMGEKAWEAPIEAAEGPASLSPPAFGSDGRAFALSGEDLVCLNPRGMRLWKLPLPSAASGPPSIDGLGRPCVALEDGSLLVATPYGEVAARSALGGASTLLFPIASPPGEGGKPLLAACLPDGSLLLVGADGGTKILYRSGAVILSLALGGSVLFGLDASGEAFAMTLGGKVAWTVATGCSKGRLSLFSDRLVAVGRGRAVSLSLKGEVYRELGIPGASGTAAVSPAGLVYSSGSDWILAAYRFERRLGRPRLPISPPYPALPDVASRTLLFDPFAADPDDQMRRLADIEKSLRSGTIGRDEPESAAYCAAVATGALDRDLSQEERYRGGNPLPRSRACYLLGEIGSPAYRGPLFRVIESDVDPAVRASACEALALIGVDPDGASMSAFLSAAARPADERTAFVIAAAIEAMALRSGSAPSEDGIGALVKLMAMPYGQAIRNRAFAALERISGASR
jgi:hypothetical protein